MNCTGKRCIMQFDKVDPATCKCVNYCPQATPPITNADCIRAMSDEELRDMFFWIQHNILGRYNDSYLGLLDWLKQEIN